MSTDAAFFNTREDWQTRGFHMRSPPVMLIGYDAAGDGDDRDALVLTAREEHQKGEPWDPDFAVLQRFRVLMAHRLPPELEFPDKLGQLLRLHRHMLGWKSAGRIHSHFFCIETNGVGYAIASALRSKIGNNVLGYTTVGRMTNESYVGKRMSMPRLAALDHVRYLAEIHCLKVAVGAPGGDELVREMSSFVWRSPGRPEAIEGQHDDLVLSMTGTVWIGSKILPPTLKAQSYARSVQKERVH